MYAYIHMYIIYVCVCVYIYRCVYAHTHNRAAQRGDSLKGIYAYLIFISHQPLPFSRCFSVLFLFVVSFFMLAMPTPTLFPLFIFVVVEQGPGRGALRPHQGGGEGELLTSNPNLCVLSSLGSPQPPTLPVSRCLFSCCRTRA